MKFGIKIKFCKFLGTGHLIDKKKMRDSNDFLIEIFNLPPMLLVFFHFSPFSFNSTIPFNKKKKKQKANEL